MKRHWSGFTLIEVIIAMTIMAMIALMLYWSFAMGARVWETQDLKTSTVQRQEALIRMLGDDFHGLAPYTMRWERGTLDFFAAGPTALFYVTRSGFGALHREGKALFFACFFVRQDATGAIELAVYKTSVPDPALMEELHAFQTMGELARARFIPGQYLLDEAVVVLGGLDEAVFSIVQEPFKPFAGPAQASMVVDDRPEPLDEWVRAGFPGQVHLRYVLEGRETELVFLPHQGVL